MRDVAGEVTLLVRPQDLGRVAGRVVNLDASGLEDEKRKVAVANLEKDVAGSKMQPGRAGTFCNLVNLLLRQLWKRDNIQIEFVHVPE